MAERVAAERGESLGTSVGYSIRLRHQLPRNRGSITFCTTGILLRRLRGDKDLSNLSHIIVDEVRFSVYALTRSTCHNFFSLQLIVQVHERDVQTDFLLILLHDLLSRRPDLKVVLMSATLNADSFSQYFHAAPMAHIPGFTFPVDEIYLEDVIDSVR